MRRSKRLYLLYEDWPEDDRTRWEAAFKAVNNLFDDQGPAAHLAERTRLQVPEYAYGKFLAFLSARHSRLLALPPAERLNRKIIRDYVKWQPRTCGGITLSIYLFHLWFTLRYLCPGDDWAWLLTISKRIRDQGKPKPQQHHLVTSELLYSLGIQLMDRALAGGKPATSWRVQTGVRDGLIIALLALVPLRRRTLSALKISIHLVRSGDQWVLDIPASDIKTKRPLEYPLSAELLERIDIYLNQVRPRIAGARLSLGLLPRSADERQRYLQCCSAPYPQSARLSNEPAPVPSRSSYTVVCARPGKCAWRQRPAWSFLIRHNGKILRHGAITTCRARSR